LAEKINGEIISADSRQVYKNMDIGTGKDLNEYIVKGKPIPYHLIDICEAGSRYLLPDFQRDFNTAFQEITTNNKTAILCGGTGLYLEAVLENHQFTNIPENIDFRVSVNEKTHEELLLQFDAINKPTTFSPDLSTRKRTVRAIELALHFERKPLSETKKIDFEPIIFGLNISRELRREKISKRLHERLSNRMIEEVQDLLKSGISADDLAYYGLEYKFITEYLAGDLSLTEMTNRLEIAIHQFAKRQMTWFRRMEKKGHLIHWIDTETEQQEQLDFIQKTLNT